jgi:hypothetical protein
MKAKGTVTIRWTHHADYFRLALESWKRIQQLKQEHDAIQASLERHDGASDDIAEQLAAKNDEIGKLALVVIVFCAFALEAYINDYAINRLSRSYFKKYLDRLDLVAKWVVIPRLVAQKPVDPGSRALQDVAWLVGLRNDLAHYKSKEVTIEQLTVSDFLWYEDARRAIGAVRSAVSALRAVDRKAEAEWLESEE